MVDQVTLATHHAVVGLIHDAWAVGRSLPLADAIVEARVLATELTVSLVPPRPQAKAVGLTPREHEVLRLLVEGKSDREIGESR